MLLEKLVMCLNGYNFFLILCPCVLLRYAFKALMPSIWRERNGRRYGEQPTEASILTKLVDKTVRLKLSVQRQRKEISR